MAPGTRGGSYPTSVLLFTVALAAAAVVGGAIAGSVGAPARPSWWAWGLLALALTAAGSLHVELRNGDEVDAVDLFEAALAPVIFLVGGVGAVAIAAVAKAVAEAAMRISPVKATFDVAQWAAATAAGSLVLGLLAGPGRRPSDLPWLLVAMLAVAVVNHAAFVTVRRLVGAGTVRGVMGVLRPVVLAAWGVGGAVNLAAGVLFAAGAAWAPGVAVLVPVVLGALHLASRGYATILAERAQLEVVQRATHALLSSIDPAEALPAFLAEVRAGVRSDAAELLVVGEAGSEVRRVDADRSSSRSPLAPTESALVDAVLAAPGPLSGEIDGDPDPALLGVLAARGHREAMCVPVRSGTVVAALCVYDREGRRSGADAELAVLHALAGELAQALHRQQLHVALQASEERFRSLVHRSSDVTAVVDRDGVLRYVSPAAGLVIGLAPEDAVGRPVDDLLHPDDRAVLGAALGETLAEAGSTATVELRVRVTPDEPWRHIETVVTNLVDDPAVGGYVLNSRDVSERKRDEDLLAGQARTLEAIARDVPLREVLDTVASVVQGHAPGISAGIMVRHRGEELAVGPGQPIVEALLGALRSVRRTGAGLDRPRQPLVVEDLHADPAWAGVAGVAAGLGVCAAWAVPLLVRGEVAGVVAVFSSTAGGPDRSQRRLVERSAHLVDIALDRNRARVQLVARAARDGLTGLPNRVLFQDRLKLAMARAARTRSALAVLLIDLDRFTLVNDSLGRSAGDQVLVTLAGRLTALLRPGDTVARAAGDEFAMLCEELVDERDAVVVAERVARAIAAPVIVAGREVLVTASVGIALAGGTSLRPEILIDNADAASYRAKAKGGGGWEVFQERMRAASMERLAIHSGLHRALERDEFRVVYQPVIDLRSGRLVGVEALVRWDHPVRGIVAPAEFIASAEETGLIVPIGAHVLREACRQARRWRDAGHDLTVAVNLSARQFGDPALVQVVAGVLAETGLDASAVVLEITETVLMDDADRTVRSLEGLKSLGVRLSIDDFGTGYSSLTYLKRFPVDGLKVDRSFVDGMATDEDDNAIVAAVVTLARSLGISAIAEGVESGDQLARLQDLGCEVGQGYFFSRPLPAAELDLAGVAAFAAGLPGSGRR